jgi:hypothetical protein
MNFGLGPVELGLGDVLSMLWAVPLMLGLSAPGRPVRQRIA